MEVKEQQPYPVHPERFDHYRQLLCRTGLAGRCYWEVQWQGMVCIAVTYRGISRTGEGPGSMLGGNDQSWSLYCSSTTCFAFHNNTKRDVTLPSSSANRVGVYLDWPSGTLSFYAVSSETLIHLHTFRVAFTAPLYPAFRVGFQHALFGSSVTLCEVMKEESSPQSSGAAASEPGS